MIIGPSEKLADRMREREKAIERGTEPQTLLQGSTFNLVCLTSLPLLSSSASESDTAAPPLADGGEADLLALLSRQVFAHDFSLPPSPPLTNSSAGPWPRAAPDFLFPPPPDSLSHSSPPLTLTLSFASPLPSFRA